MAGEEGVREHGESIIWEENGQDTTFTSLSFVPKFHLIFIVMRVS